MPELPEVETVKAALDEVVKDKMIHHIITSGKNMRWPIPSDLEERINGAMITHVRRRAKYILMGMKTRQQDLCLILHLGMSGSVRIYPEPITDIIPKKHDHLIIGCRDSQQSGEKNGHITAVLNDPRRFGGVALILADAVDAHPLIKNLGPEPLGNQWNGDALHAAITTRQAPIKSVLLDQHVVAGIGNIYASEALYLAGITPRRKASRISKAKANDLTRSVRQVLEKAIAAGGTSLRDHVQPGGEIGYFAQQLHVYGREGKPCHHCAKPIKMIRQSGRASFYCSQCQR
jgi:formamidopyrimidine-DNA glycosylase